MLKAVIITGAVCMCAALIFAALITLDKNSIRKRSWVKLFRIAIICGALCMILITLLRSDRFKIINKIEVGRLQSYTVVTTVDLKKGSVDPTQNIMLEEQPLIRRDGDNLIIGSKDYMITVRGVTNTTLKKLDKYKDIETVTVYGHIEKADTSSAVICAAYEEAPAAERSRQFMYLVVLIMVGSMIGTLAGRR